MIRVSVLYPNEAEKKFDHDYYANQHLPLVKELLGETLLRAEVDRGVGSAEPGAPAPFVAVGHLTFDSLDDFQTAFLSWRPRPRSVTDAAVAGGLAVFVLPGVAGCAGPGRYSLACAMGGT